jgi:hypothetical protein
MHDCMLRHSVKVQNHLDCLVAIVAKLYLATHHLSFRQGPLQGVSGCCKVHAADVCLTSRVALHATQLLPLYVYIARAFVLPQSATALVQGNSALVDELQHRLICHVPHAKPRLKACERPAQECNQLPLLLSRRATAELLTACGHTSLVRCDRPPSRASAGIPIALVDARRNMLPDGPRDTNRPLQTSLQCLRDAYMCVLTWSSRPRPVPLTDSCAANSLPIRVSPYIASTEVVS